MRHSPCGVPARFTAGLSLFLFCLLFLPTFSAAEPPAEEAPPLRPVVVTATAEPDDLKSIPASVQVVSSQEIERSGASTLTELLKRTTAVGMIVQPGNYSRVILRGFSSGKSVANTFSDQVLILIDGHRSGTGNIDNLPVSNIERVEVLRGPASVLYGGSAVGGVINVITKRGKGPVKANAEAETGSFHRYAGKAGIAGGFLDDRLGVAAAVQTDTAGDYTTGNGKRYVNSAYHRSGGGATLTWRPEEKTSLAGVFAVHEAYDSGSPGDIYWPTPNSKMRNSWLYGAMELDSRLDNGVGLQASLYANQNAYTDDNREDWPYTSRYDARMLGARTVLGLPVPQLADLKLGRLAVGAEYILHKQQLGGSSVSEPDSSTDVYSLFAEHRFSPVSSLTLQYGVRYDYYDMESEEVSGLDVKAGSHSFGHLTWTAGATWWMLDWLGLRTSVGSAYVPPSSMQLAGEYTSWGTTYIGDPDLKAESSLTWDMGLEFEKFGITASLGYFSTRYKDRIGTEVVSAGFPREVKYANYGEQRVNGLEAGLRYEYSRELGGRTFTVAPYTNWEYLTERRNIDSESPTSTITDLPRYTGLAGIGLGLGAFWLDVNAQFIGGHVGYDFSKYEYRTFDSTTLINARLTVKPVDKLSVYLDVRNITDEYYGYKPEFPMPGRTFTVGLRYEY